MEHLPVNTPLTGEKLETIFRQALGSWPIVTLTNYFAHEEETVFELSYTVNDQEIQIRELDSNKNFLRLRPSKDVKVNSPYVAGGYYTPLLQILVNILINDPILVFGEGDDTVEAKIRSL